MSNLEVQKQLAALKVEQAAIDARGETLFAQLVCECCGGKDDIGIRPIMCRDPICKHCFTVWHEHGLQDAEKVRDKSLEIQGRALSAGASPDAGPR
jgi:hypothetical protein